MRSSRGMGAIMPNKMPGKKIIHRKDDPNKVELYKKGGMIKKYAKGGSVSSASKRADGCATKGKTKGRMM